MARRNLLRRLRWSIARKLGVASWLMILLALVGGGISLWQTGIISGAVDTAIQTQENLEASLTLPAAGNRLVASLDYMISAHDPGPASTDLPIAIGLMDFYIQQLREANLQGRAGELAESADLLYMRLRDAVGRINVAIRSEDWATAEDLLEQEIRPTNRALTLTVFQLVQQFRQAAIATSAQAETAVRNALWIVTAGVLAAAAIAVGWRQAIFQDMARSITELRRGVARITSGDLTYELRIDTGDEIEELGNEFNRMAAELRGLITGLEERVAERTRDLERRTIQLQAAAEVAREAAAIRDPDALLNDVVHLISDRFGFYHAGIFLVDEAREYAILRSASSEGGRRMLERGHRLKVGEVGIVGYVAGTGEPRIALDVGKDAVFFDNPDLPLTRSEMALPLRVRGEVIGVLDVQSEEPAAFTEEDIAVLQVMADQIALAIENARLLEESQRTLRELERVYGERVREAWETLQSPAALVYDRIEVAPAEPTADPLVEKALEEGEIVTGANPEERRSAVVAPLRLRDQVIGAIAVEETDEARSWTQEELELIEAVSEQVALALESARLYTEAQERAEEQETLARIAAMASTTLDLDELLTRIVEETRRVAEAESAVLLTVDEDANALIARYVASVEETTVPTGWAVPLDAPGMEVGILARGDMYYTNRAMDDPNVIPAYRPYMEQLGVRNFCGVALRARERNIGELYVINRAAGFGEDEARLLRALAGYAANAIENARLFEEARLHAEELAVLNELAQHLTARLNVEEVVEESYQGVARLLDATNFYIALYDPETETVSFPLAVEDGQKVTWRSRRKGKGLTEYILQTKEPLLIAEDVASRLQELGIDLIGRTALSWLGVPILLGNRVLGVIAVQSYTTPRAYTEHHLDLLTAVASQVAIALQNARLFEAVQEEQARLATLYEVSRRLGEAPTLEEAAAAALEIAPYVGAQHADLILFDVGGRPFLHSSVPDRADFTPEQAEEYIRQVTTRGLQAWVLEHRRTALVTDTREDPRWLILPGHEERDPVRSAICAPLFDRRGQVMGTLSYTCPEPGAFTEEEQRLVEEIAARVAVTLENARLFAETQEALAETEALYRAARAISEATSLEEIVRGAAEVARPLGFDACSVVVATLTDPEGVPTHGDIYSVVYSEGDWVALPPAMAFPIHDRAAARRVLDEPNFVMVYSDIDDPDTKIPDAVREVARGMGMRGMVTAGLSIFGRALGFLTFTSQGPVGDLLETHVRRIRTIADQVAVALENRRLLEETTRRAAQLATAAEVSSAASSILDPEELLPQTAELIRERFDLYYVGIFLLDEAGRWAVLQAGTGEAGRQMLERGHKLEVGGQSMIGWCTAHGEARIALDVGAEAVRFDNPLLPETRSEMALPLVSRGRVIGAMTIQSDKPAAFSEEDITALQTMADQLATAIENARLFAETQRSLKETQELYEAGRAIGAATTPAEVGQALVEYAAHTDLTVARLLLYEFEENKPVHLVTAESWTVDGRPVHPYGTRLSMDEYALARLLRPDESLVVEDVHTDTRLDKPTRLLAEVVQIRSFAVVPLTIGTRLVGGLLVGRDGPSTFSERLLNNLWTLCGQAAIAVENLRLLEETRRRARELEALNEITRAITSVLDPESVVRQIVDTTKERFGYYFVSLLLVEGDRLVFMDGSTIGDTHRRLGRRSVILDLGRPSITTDAVRTGQPVLVNDVLFDPRYVTVPELSDTRSELAVPIEVKGEIVGVLDVQSDRPYAYSRTDMLLLQSLAGQAGVAIENARLFAEVEATARRRALISEVLEAGATSLDPDDLLHRVAEAISLRLEMPCGIFEWDPEVEALRPAVVYDATGKPAPLPEEVPTLTAEANPAMFEAIRTRQLRVLPDVPSHTRGPMLSLAQAVEVQDAAYVPLIARERVLGILALGRQPDHPPFDEDELEFIQIVGANLSVAWENARLYREAVETAERLKEVDRLKSQFLANMSHELRTPLNSIIGFSRVILKGIDGPITDMQRQDLEAIYNSGQHLLGLINDILDISKIEAGKMELEFRPVDLKEIIRGVMSTAIALVKDKPIDLQQSVPADLPTIIADERRVRQILLNLVSNAAKFTDEGYIRVEVTYDDEYVTISVSDSGIGIPEDKLPRIFEAFTQVDASPSRKYGGTGLGLTITKSFIELHGGEIWVESEVGKGTTFTFKLPIQGPPSPEEEEEPEVKEVTQPVEAGEAPQPERSGKIVLCVDDDEGVITLFRRYLDKQGYQVIGLTDPRRVVEEAKRLKPYAITLDVMMPEKDGWEVIRELKADPGTKDIPVVMCTIVSDEGKGLSLGAADYLVKPILEQDLLAALDRLDREAGRHRVLVVDDQAEDRELLRRIIESQDGFEVIEASSGQEAIALVKQLRPHIIILDLLMPEVDGFAVLEAMKADKSTRNIPIIVVTAKELTEEDRALLNHRIEALVQKGLLNQEELLQDVLAALKKVGREGNDRK